MLRRTGKPFQAGVALICAVMVVLAPFARQVHQVFANHRHVYSSASGLVIDAGPRETGATGPSAIPGRHPAPTSVQVANDLPVAASPCAVSNLALVHSLAAADPGFVLEPRRHREPASYRASDSRASGRILRFAPKNSPPRSLA